MKQCGHILVVDDNQLNRLELAQALKKQGHSTVLAEDGLKALDALEQDHFDLVMLDILMPNMDGFGVLENMKADGQLRDIPVLVISAIDEMDSIVKCIRLGAEDYLPKPSDLTLLEARVTACLEKKRLREAIVSQLGKYVPESVAASIINDQKALKPKRTIATVLYTDIENFTGIAESMPPERVFEMLNEYFATLAESIMAHGGVVNQFQGDAMLVTYNVPLEDPEHADNALKTAIEIQDRSSREKFAGVSLRTRIGVNTGEVIAGNVGSGTRVTYTVHGDAVNSAARLEQLNKQYDTHTLVSASTVEHLRGSYQLREIGEVPIRGKHEGMCVFELTGSLGESDA
jgi:class 3 adenylate cyclase